MSTSTIDLQAQAQKRIAGLLALSKRFRGVLTAIVTGFAEVQEALRSVDRMLDIDTQGGVVLDIIGALVGQPRRLLGAAPRSFFGFRIDSPASFQRALPYGDRKYPSRGGLLWDRGAALTGSALMTDPDYRFAIRARIIKNSTRIDGTEAWIERIYRVLLTILTDANTTVGGVTTHNYPLWAIDRRMTIVICIGRPVAAREIALLAQADLIPVPDGVQLQFTQWDNTKKVMGFIGQTANVSGYGDRAYPSRGGRLAERMSQNVAG